MLRITAAMVVHHLRTKGLNTASPGPFGWLPAILADDFGFPATFGLSARLPSESDGKFSYYLCN